ncbi:MAG TPA: flagellar biosynthetic protein FliR [Bryobacteraceae bacterium]|nr:flagellar biosynthetic protein FliR [Bryobacteraceae bacterium]
MHADSLFTYAALFGFLFTLARVSCVFAFLPLAAFKGAPDASKVILSLAFTIILWPEWKGPVTANWTIGRIVTGIASEATLGFAVGLALAVVLEVFQMAAQIITTQAGFGFASTIDPNSGADSTVLLTIAQLTAGLLFFVTGSDRMLVRAMADSLRLCPPESFSVQPGWGEALIQFVSSIFSSGLRLAAPVIALLLLADAALAVLGRIQTQIHLVSLTLPVKLGGAMLVISATLIFQPRFFGSLMTNAIRLMEEIFRNGH